MAVHFTPTITLFEREDWGARSADLRRIAKQDLDTVDEAFLHHSDDDPDATRQLTTLDKQKAKVRAIQDFHMDGRGWADIAYHYIVFQAYGDIPYARAFEGRKRWWVPAAQEAHNQGTLAICVVGDFSVGGNDLKTNTRYCIEVLLDRISSLKTVGGHRDVVSTSCPGVNIYQDIPIIADAVNLRRYGR